MKVIKCRLLCAALLLSLFPGCSGTDGQSSAGGSLQEQGTNAGETSSMQEEAFSSSYEEESIALPGSSQGVEGEINTAISIIPGADELDGFEDGLFLLKEYGTDMGWSEANELAHLDRGTPFNEVGQYDLYFLLIPKYIGCRVEVNRMAYDNEKGVYPAESIYLNTDTPDSYGLVLTSREPETMPELAVTVEYHGTEYTYQFLYDGRGDRPAVRLFSGASPQQRPSDELFVYGWTSEGRELEAEIPASWGEGPHFSFHTEINDEMAKYQITFYPLQAGDLENTLVPEMNEEVHRLVLEDGRPCLYVLERDSPVKYMYALEVDDMIQVVQVYVIPDIPESPEYSLTLRPPSDVDIRFLSMLASIH